MTACHSRVVRSASISAGVRVMPEWDGPGHSASFGVGYPNVVANCPKYSANINNIPMSPASPQTLPLLNGLYAESAKLFPDSFTHFGGDEVVENCWLNDPAVVAWMHQQSPNYTAADVYGYFIKNAYSQAVANGQSAMFWQEVFNKYVCVCLCVCVCVCTRIAIAVDLTEPLFCCSNIIQKVAPPGQSNSPVIEVWEDLATLGQVINAGYQAVLAAGNASYFVISSIIAPVFNF